MHSSSMPSTEESSFGSVVDAHWKKEPKLWFGERTTWSNTYVVAPETDRHYPFSIFPVGLKWLVSSRRPSLLSSRNGSVTGSTRRRRILSSRCSSRFLMRAGCFVSSRLPTSPRKTSTVTTWWFWMRWTWSMFGWVRMPTRMRRRRRWTLRRSIWRRTSCHVTKKRASTRSTKDRNLQRSRSSSLLGMTTSSRTWVVQRLSLQTFTVSASALRREHAPSAVQLICSATSFECLNCNKPILIYV